jgi:hypothetical protein
MATRKGGTKALLIRDAEIFNYHEIEGRTLEETAELVGVSRSTVVKARQKETYNQLAINALQQRKMPVDQYAEKLVEATEAKKALNIRGVRHEEPDNLTRMTALKEIGAIYGVYRPKQINLQHGLAGAPDEVLDAEIEELSEKISSHAAGPGKGHVKPKAERAEGGADKKGP